MRREMEPRLQERVRPADPGRYDRHVSAAPADRVRTLLLRADNLLKNSPEGRDDDRAVRARAALQEAAEVAQDPDLDPRVRELVDRRIAAVDLLIGDAGA